MDSYGRHLGILSKYSQAHHYHYLLKQEALMRLCAEQAQNYISFYTKPFSHEPLKESILPVNKARFPQDSL